MQEYVGIPRIVQFSPILRKSLPSLRRKRQIDPQSDRSVLEEGTSEQLPGGYLDTSDVLIEQCEEFITGAEFGKFYVVLGDSLDGYYLVKCSSSNLETFSGKYLALSSETLPGKIMYRETQDSDNFDSGTIVSEVSVSAEVLGKNTRRFSVNKEELDDILMTISQLSEV